MKNVNTYEEKDMSERITFRCSSRHRKSKIMKFLKRFGDGTTSTAGFNKLIDLARQVEVDAMQLEKLLRKKVEREWFGGEL